MEKIDRISSLSDCLLHLILSFLKTKESARTTILSKRWIDVWKSMPCLDLEPFDLNPVQIEKFGNFVKFVLHDKLITAEKLDTFILRWPYEGYEYLTIDTWIQDLPCLKPRVVKIEVSEMIRMSFALRLFTCTSLESIILLPTSPRSRLRWYHWTEMFINLPCLKSLSLGSLVLTYGFLDILILGCPILEKLVLDDCDLCEAGNITCSTLKTLVLKQCSISRDSSICKPNLGICTPNLEYLSCEVLVNKVSFENLSSLECACVKPEVSKHTCDEDVFKFLSGLSNVKTLRFSGCNIDKKKRLQKKASSDFPVFENLKYLVLESFAINPESGPIYSLLRHAPNLEKLTLQDIEMEKRRDLGRRRFNEIQCDRLKTIEILRPKSYEGVNKLVHYLEVHIKAPKKIITINGIDASFIFVGISGFFQVSRDMNYHQQLDS